MSCNLFNQYHTDIVDSSGRLVTIKCFDGTKIYRQTKTMNVNNYKNYQNIPYYTWINNNFKNYSFPDDNFLSSSYSPDAEFSRNCESKEFSLKPQQKLAGRIFNTHTDINSMLIYHGLGSGKTITSIVIGESFKFFDTADGIIPGRTYSRVLLVVPAALEEQYYYEIIGKYQDNILKSASSEIVIYGKRQYYTSQRIRGTINLAYERIKMLHESRNIITESNALNKIDREIAEIKIDIERMKDDENIKINKVYEIISHEKFLNRLFTIKNGVYT